MEGLLECLSIANLDLSNNHISYSQEILDIFAKTNLSCLYLKANGISIFQYYNIVRECPNYRKTLIVAIEKL
jgi:Ran GTPase-activating protein (RanGAP) involved in mRNA processing and transport